MKDYISGTWEIKEVYQNGDLIKSYKVSSQVDYFEILTDSTGFRKKLMPGFDGSFRTSDHRSNFKLEIQDSGLALIYLNEEENYTEWITEVTKKKLVLINPQGLEYHYGKFEPLILEDE